MLVILLTTVSNSKAADISDPSGQPWRVVTIPSEPFTIISNYDAGSPDQNNYVGLIPDILREIGYRLGQNYTFYLVPDRRYGFRDQSGGWKGMIGEVINRNADFAAAPLTISSRRWSVVDFAEPFMDNDIVVLVKKQRGSKIKSFQELIEKQDMTFGVVRPGSTEHILKQSIKPEIEQLLSKVRGVGTRESGAQMVRQSNGTFGFITEESFALYMKNSLSCDLDFVPVKILPPYKYAFASWKGSPYTEEISKVIRDMKMTGVMYELKNKWWPNSCSEA